MKDREFFNRHAETRGEFKPIEDAEYGRILDAMGLDRENTGQRVLDVGCGSGAFSVHLHDRGFRVTGIDISEGLIKVGEKVCAGKDIRLIAGNIFEHRFEEKFDIVFCVAVLHHFTRDLERLIERVNAVLPGGGRVYVCEPLAGARHRLLTFLHKKFGAGCQECTDDEDAIDPRRLDALFTVRGYERCAARELRGIRERKKTVEGTLDKVSYRMRKLFSQVLLPHPYVLLKYRRIKE